MSHKDVEQIMQHQRLIVKSSILNIANINGDDCLTMHY